jgi:hypothetical protein
MIDAAAAAAVAAAAPDGVVTRPLYGSYCFSSITSTLEWLVGAGGEPAIPRASLAGLEAPSRPVALVFLDAFGLAFLERHADHPFARRLLDDGHVIPLTSQFPSTTTAHVTTLASGLTVGQTGLYEWFQYEPALDAVIVPLQFAYAGDAPGSLLLAGADAQALYPFPTLHRRLADAGLQSAMLLDAGIVPSPWSRTMLAGATIHPHAAVADGIADLAALLRAPEPPALATLYLDAIDAIGHRRGPGSGEFAATVEGILTQLEEVLVPALPDGAVLLVTADHGQLPAEPDDAIYVNELWPGLEPLMRPNARGAPIAPAGSPRDLFLHVRPEAVDEVAGRLGELLDGRARVVRSDALIAEGLFGPEVSPRLRERVGEVAVLPVAGEEVWWHEPGRFEQKLRGHHGGLATAEALTYLAVLRP